MYVIGSDRIRVTDGRVEPAGDRHAVDADGLAVCRDRGPVYLFPALGWSSQDTAGAVCAVCTGAVAALRTPATAAAYPSVDLAGQLLEAQGS
ncbi:MAG: hypothetical protein QOJ03_3163 [Frankiaceae bacterium]|jgi:hypothetical protein|nr:hypothetical protein [Frankiaceae bacterium]